MKEKESEEGQHHKKSNELKAEDFFVYREGSDDQSGLTEAFELWFKAKLMELELMKI